MLTLIPKDTWREQIIDVKIGKFPPNHDLKDMETLLINELLKEGSSACPYDLEEIIESSNCLVDMEEG